MKVFITGADGMLGSHIVLELLKRNHEVSAFVLPNRPVLFPDLDINRIEGNLLNEEQVIQAVEGHDAIIHVAAMTDVWPYRYELLRKVNIDGTKVIAKAAQKANAKRFVMIVSACSCGIGTKEKPGTEETPFVSDKYGLDYIDSKKIAQDYIIKEAKENGLPAIIINPTFMFGAYDEKPGAGKMIKALYQGKVPGYTMGGKNYVAAKDVSVGAVNALTMGRIGECYIAGNENLNFKEAFEKISNVLGVSAPKLAIPTWLNLSIGWISEKIALATNSTPTLSYRTMRIGCDEHYFSAEKARKELQLPQTNIEIAIKECFEWMRDNGVLDKK